jgi:hypothetical protein
MRTLVSWALVLAIGCGPSDAQVPKSIAPPPVAAAPSPGLGSALIAGVPHVRQKPDFCGEADIESDLRFRGQSTSQDQVFGLSAMPPERGRGATTRELTHALERLGFDPGPVWYEVAPANSTHELAGLFAELHADLVRQIPSIVCMRYDASPGTSEHFRLVLGYDKDRDEVVYHEPAEAHGGYRRMPRERFFGLWPLKYRTDRWTVIRLRLAAERIVVPPAESGHTRADFAQHVRGLRRRLPAGYQVAVEPPFVVVGNGSPSRVRDLAEGTVRWAVTLLKKSFFNRDPSRILEIWLLEDDASYRQATVDLIGRQPTTPFGYFDDKRGVLVMNIATGGGTLVHEIVHPFIDANFEQCPAWFNEGLGSLYEQSAERDGRIVGRTNWRLAGLQRAIRRGSLPSLRHLMHTTSAAFYEQDRGTNYAQARYLLYYLQEKDLLIRYYREFLAHGARDPSGYRTLISVLGTPDMADFQHDWENYVLGLRFRSADF